MHIRAVQAHTRRPWEAWAWGWSRGDRKRRHWPTSARPCPLAWSLVLSLRVVVGKYCPVQENPPPHDGSHCVQHPAPGAAEPPSQPRLPALPFTAHPGLLPRFLLASSSCRLSPGLHVCT